MANVLEILVKVLMGDSHPKLDGLKKAIADSGAAADKSSSNMTKWGKSIASSVLPAVTAGAAVVALGKFLKESVTAAAEAEAVQAQLNAVLEATGGAAGMSAESLNRLADSLSYMSGVDDEVIVGAETLMLTFTKISKETFPRAMKAALDMSTVLKIDLQSAVKMVGMALNSPAEGFTRLQRAGVSFTDSQKEMIKTLAETGREAEAQALILGALEGKYEGAAEAAGETFAGSVARLNVAWENFKEIIGTGVIPELTDLMNKITGFILLAQLQASAVDDLGLSWDELEGMYNDAGLSLWDFQGRAELLIPLLEEQAEKDDAVAAATRGIMGAAQDAVPALDELADGFAETGEQAKIAEVKFDDWAKGLDTNLASGIDKALDNIAWFVAGGAELSERFTAIQWDITMGGSIDQARTDMQQLYIDTQKVAVEAGQIEFNVAAGQIAETLGIAITTAKVLLEATVLEAPTEVEPFDESMHEALVAAGKMVDDDAASILEPLNAEIEGIGPAFETGAEDGSNALNGTLSPAVDTLKGKIDLLVAPKTINIGLLMDMIAYNKISAELDTLTRDRTVNIKLNYIESDAPGGQHGLDMIVPSGYPNDTFPVLASSGEHVTITPSGAYMGYGGKMMNAGMGGGGQTVVQVIFNAPVMGFSDEYDLALKLEPVIKRVVGR